MPALLRFHVPMRLHDIFCVDIHFFPGEYDLIVLARFSMETKTTPKLRYPEKEEVNVRNLMTVSLRECNDWADCMGIQSWQGRKEQKMTLNFSTFWQEEWERWKFCESASDPTWLLFHLRELYYQACWIHSVNVTREAGVKHIMENLKVIINFENHSHGNQVECFKVRSLCSF